MDYMDVPKSVLDLAVKVSKAAKAEYWACDVAYGKDGVPRILECATAFAAFPYIRDWIAEYLMWSLSEGRFRKPHAPMFNWEELGKMDSSILRTLRHIHFGKFNASYDGAYFGKKRKNYGGKKVYLHELDAKYPMLDVKRRYAEEWPSEIYNYQDKLALKPAKNMKTKPPKAKDVPNPISPDESSESVLNESKITKKELKEFLTSVDGIGKKKAKKIIKHFGSPDEVIGVIHQNTSILTEVKGISKKIVAKVEKAWKKLLK
jgi:DNA uptake protein ComE-like DNA-binding protein